MDASESWSRLTILSPDKKNKWHTNTVPLQTSPAPVSCRHCGWRQEYLVMTTSKIWLDQILWFRFSVSFYEIPWSVLQLYMHSRTMQSIAMPWWDDLMQSVSVHVVNWFGKVQRNSMFGNCVSDNQDSFVGSIADFCAELVPFSLTTSIHNENHHFTVAPGRTQKYALNLTLRPSLVATSTYLKVHFLIRVDAWEANNEPIDQQWPCCKLSL